MFTNKKTVIILLSSLLLIGISLLLFPNIFKPGIDKVLRKPVNTEVTKITTQSKDTSLESIEKDLDATELRDIDKEMQLIENEINASI